MYKSRKTTTAKRPSINSFLTTSSASLVCNNTLSISPFTSRYLVPYSYSSLNLSLLLENWSSGFIQEEQWCLTVCGYLSTSFFVCVSFIFYLYTIKFTLFVDYSESCNHYHYNQDTEQLHYYLLPSSSVGDCDLHTKRR